MRRTRRRQRLPTKPPKVIIITVAGTTYRVRRHATRYTPEKDQVRIS